MGSISLIETAKLLTRYLREADVVGRVGGDEFVVAGHFNREQAAIAIERIRGAVSQMNLVANNRFAISLSIGCATTEDFVPTLQDLISNADEAMYQEKRHKKSQAMTAAKL